MACALLSEKCHNNFIPKTLAKQRDSPKLPSTFLALLLGMLCLICNFFYGKITNKNIYIHLLAFFLACLFVF